jgi:hypothetical protein
LGLGVYLGNHNACAERVAVFTALLVAASTNLRRGGAHKKFKHIVRDEIMRSKSIITGTFTIILVVLMVLSLIPTVTSDGGSGPRGADILLVNDGAQTTGCFKIMNALTAAGYSVQYVPSEASLPVGWDDPDVYQSIFWVGGCYFYLTYYWFTEVPSGTNAGRITAYVQNGGNFLGTGNAFDYTGHYTGLTEQPFFNNVLRSYCGNLWDGGASGTAYPSYKTVIISDSTHDIFNEPNVIPTSWSLGATPGTNYIFWFNPSGLLPGGLQIARTWSYNAIVVSDVGGNSGRTVLIRHPLEFNWDITNRGDILTPIVQNVAKWFSSGIPANVKVEPQSLNRFSKGNLVNVKVSGFPENPEYNAYDVDGQTVTIQGISVDVKFGTYNLNKFIGKADRLLVEDAIGAPGDETEVTIEGKLSDGTSFSGISIIKTM